MNNQQENTQNENNELQAYNISKIKAPTSLKRTSICPDSKSKIPKLNAKVDSKKEEIKPKDPPNIQGTTFSIPAKPVPINQKPVPFSQRRVISVNRSAVNRTANTTATGGAKARPSWDIRGRLADLEIAYKEKDNTTSQKINDLEQECANLKTVHENNETKLNELSEKNTQLNTENIELNAFISEARVENSKLTQSVQKLSEKNLYLNQTIIELQNENDNLKIKIDKIQEEISLLEKLRSELIEKCSDFEQTLKFKNEKINIQESEFKKLTLLLTSKSEELTQKTMEYRECKVKLDAVSSELENTREKFNELTKSFETLSILLENKCNEVSTLHVELNQLKTEQERLSSSLNSGKTKILSTIAENERLGAQNLEKENIISDLKIKIEEISRSRDKLLNSLGVSGSELSLLRSEVDRCHSELARADCDRRLMHHQIMELRGTIRVCCRMRPTIDEESDKTCYTIDFRGDGSITICSAEGRETVTGDIAESNKLQFTFDRFFGPISSQREVFEEIEPLIQSALDGYSVCIFAYGQTGSGKTYTMEGSFDSLDSIGIIKRAVDKIFESVPKMNCKGWEYEIKASFIEIYNENLRDLLCNSESLQNSKLEIKMAEGGKTKKDITKNGYPSIAEVSVPNLTTKIVTSASEVEVLLKIANRNRTVAATKCNQFSSRSHSIFRLHIIGTNSVLKQSSDAIINLVDLAGSERLDQSQVEGERLKETKFINKSLSSLRKVIESLQNKDSHIPFRNSKLTHLLQSSLGGNCKTLMIVNISPLQEHYNESICSLRFASTVNTCFIGTATQKKSKIN